MRKKYEKYNKAGEKQLIKAQSGFVTRAETDQALATQDPEWLKKVSSRIEKEARGDDAVANRIYKDELRAVYKRSYAKSVANFHESNMNFKKAQALVDKYGMTEWNDLARLNTKSLESIKKNTSYEAQRNAYSSRYNPDTDDEIREIQKMELEDKKRERNS